MQISVRFAFKYTDYMFIRVGKWLMSRLLYKNLYVIVVFCFFISNLFYGELWVPFNGLLRLIVLILMAAVVVVMELK